MEGNSPKRKACSTMDLAFQILPMPLTFPNVLSHVTGRDSIPCDAAFHIVLWSSLFGSDAMTTQLYLPNPFEVKFKQFKQKCITLHAVHTEKEILRDLNNVNYFV